MLSFFSTRWAAGVLLLGLGLLGCLFLYTSVPFSDPASSLQANGEDASRTLPDLPAGASTSSPKAAGPAKKARREYFLRLLRDPATGRIPSGIRSRELQHAATLPAASPRGGALLQGNGRTPSFSWESVGPSDVGGRTRALAMDVDDSSTLIAGGVSGGIWKTTDGGATWEFKTSPAQRMSVTSVAQDPRAGHTDTWYYVSGEYRGNSASDRGYTARYAGGGVYKSTDGGETWQLVASAADPTAFDTPFDYASRVVVSPQTGSVFVASNAFGVFRSTDGGASFVQVLGAVNDHRWSEVTVASDGTLLATLSSSGFNSGDPEDAPGVYLSRDDGATWENITPSSFPEVHDRSVAAFAPSTPAVAYVLTTTLQEAENPLTPGVPKEDVRLHRFDLSGTNPSSDDRSDHLPAFGGKSGTFNTQGGYNMTLAVKPDDPDFVVLGGRNLWRSDDGFATTPANPEDWIGGYTRSNASYALYPNQHPDQHAAVFDPNAPEQLWSGNDGGLYLTEDVTQSAPVTWSDQNNGYNVTQFYTVAMPNIAGDPRIGGGAQDNGTPYLRADRPEQGSYDISSADGSHLYFARDEFAYTSTQFGRLLRIAYDSEGDPAQFDATITPAQASGQLFINPFVVDPQDETVMYYPSGSSLWRTTSLPTATSSNGWQQISAPVSASSCNITTLGISSETPAHRLYYAFYCGSGRTPQLFRLDDARSATAPTDISLSGLPAGAYPHAIAVNPHDADEILVVHSNYNITGLFHSTDGGATFTAVEGNLTGTATLPGPSLRTAALLPTSEGIRYFLGTSTGLYATSQLDGANTEWTRQADERIAKSVVEHLDARASDARLAVGTHGRGLFIGQGEAALQPATLDAPLSTQVRGGSVLFQWQSSSEPDLAHFEVQVRSLSEGSDSEFETLTTIARSGPGVYRVEETLPPGRYAFRLRAHAPQGLTHLFPAQTEAVVQPAVLAVPLSAALGEDTVTLSWKSTVEPGVSQYVIEYRGGVTDGAWQRFAATDGTGASTYRLEEPLLPGTYQFRMRAEAPNGFTFDFFDAEAKTGYTKADMAVEGDYELTAPYPHPLRAGQSATFAVSVAEAQAVDVVLYDARGRRVRTLQREQQIEAGNSLKLSVEANALSSGVYFIRVMGADFAATEQLVIVR